MHQIYLCRLSWHKFCSFDELGGWLVVEKGALFFFYQVVFKCYIINGLTQPMAKV